MKGQVENILSSSILSGFYSMGLVEWGAEVTPSLPEQTVRIRAQNNQQLLCPLLASIRSKC